MPYDAAAIREALRAVAGWVLEATGIQVSDDGITVEERTNKLGQVTFDARISFRGPVAHEGSAPRIKFDLTKFELLGDESAQRAVFHAYSDAPDPSPVVRCYSLEELLAEKVRALAERAGRARDVYDVVNIGRSTAIEVDVAKARDLAKRKFEYKRLPVPTPDTILAEIDWAVVAGDWEHSLTHQLPVLPPVDEFRAALAEVLDWLFVPARVQAALPSVPSRAGEAPVRATPFASAALGLGRRVGVAAGPTLGGLYGWMMERVRFAARNRLLARITYGGVSRLVEPYSLRMPRTGNLLLYVYEVQRGGATGEGIKAFKVAQLGGVDVTNQSFQPRYAVEL